MSENASYELLSEIPNVYYSFLDTTPLFQTFLRIRFPNPIELFFYYIREHEDVNKTIKVHILKEYYCWLYSNSAITTVKSPIFIENFKESPLIRRNPGYDTFKKIWLDEEEGFDKKIALEMKVMEERPHYVYTLDDFLEDGVHGCVFYCKPNQFTDALKKMNLITQYQPGDIVIQHTGTFGEDKVRISFETPLMKGFPKKKFFPEELYEKFKAIIWIKITPVLFNLNPLPICPPDILLQEFKLALTPYGRALVELPKKRTAVFTSEDKYGILIKPEADIPPTFDDIKKGKYLFVPTDELLNLEKTLSLMPNFPFLLKGIPILPTYIACFLTILSRFAKEPIPLCLAKEIMDVDDATGLVLHSWNPLGTIGEAINASSIMNAISLLQEKKITKNFRETEFYGKSILDWLAGSISFSIEVIISYPPRSPLIKSEFLFDPLHPRMVRMSDERNLYSESIKQKLELDALIRQAVEQFKLEHKTVPMKNAFSDGYIKIAVGSGPFIEVSFGESPSLCYTSKVPFKMDKISAY